VFYASSPLPVLPGGRRAASFSAWAGRRPTMFLGGARDGQLRLFGAAPYAAAVAAAAESEAGPSFAAARWPFLLVAGSNHAQSSGGGALRRERGDIEAGVPFEEAVAASGGAIAAFIAAHAGRAAAAAGARAELLRAVKSTARFMAPYARAAGYGDIAAAFERKGGAAPGCPLGRGLEPGAWGGLPSGVAATVRRACEEAQRMELRGYPASVLCIVHAEGEATFDAADAEAQVADEGGTDVGSGPDPDGVALAAPAPSADDGKAAAAADDGGAADAMDGGASGGHKPPPRLLAIAHALVRYRTNGSNPVNPTAPDIVVKLVSCSVTIRLGRSGSCSGGGLNGWAAAVLQRARAALAAAQVAVGGVALVEEAPGDDWERRAALAATPAKDVARVRLLRVPGGVALRGQLLEAGATVVASLPTEALALEWLMLDAYRGEPWAG